MSGSSGRIQLVVEGPPAYASSVVHRGGGSFLLSCVGGCTGDLVTGIEAGHSGFFL